MGPNCSPLRRRPSGRAGTEHTDAISHFLAWVCGAAVGSAPARGPFLPRETIRSARSWCRTVSHPAEYACAGSCRRSPGQSGISRHFSSESVRRSLSLSRWESRNSVRGTERTPRNQFPPEGRSLRTWAFPPQPMIALSLGPFRAGG
jgi:hypothetical protein